MKHFAHSTIGIWILLFAFFLPFTYSVFPQIGIELTTSIACISEWIATNIFNVEVCTSPTTSDSLAQFVQAAILLIFSCPLAFLVLKQKRYSKKQIGQFLHTSAAYILSFFLLKYGVDKLFQFQFYSPEPNTLFTPLGMLSKDILFWSSMGTSSSYNTFMGLSEVIPAFLLLHHRTRLLGGFISFGVLVNVLAINVGFDITVKLLSFYLVVISVFVLAPNIKHLILFFFNDSGHFSKPNLRLNIGAKLKIVIKSIVIVFIFTEVLFSYFQSNSFNGRKMEKIAHFGSYDIELETILGVSNVNRIHIHNKGYLILQDTNGDFADFPIRIAPDRSVFIRNENARISISTKGKATIFNIQKDGKSIKVNSKKIDLNSLPARDDSFHLTVDGMINAHHLSD